MICPDISDLPKPEHTKKGWPWTIAAPRLPETMPDGSPWPLLTIVTPSYNQGHFLEETIRSVLLQSYPNLNYIIIDGNSSDNSRDVIKKYEPWLTHWESKPDNGQCHAINKGWAKAKPGTWAWLNSDDTYSPGTLARAVTALQQNPGAKLVFADVSHTDSEGRHLYYYYGRPLPAGIKRKCYWEGWNIPQPTVFFHHDLVRLYGGLNEEFHLGLDYELFIRFSNFASFTYVNETWATTRLHGDAKTNDWNETKASFFKENRRANRLNSGPFEFFYLRLLEFLYNRKEAALARKRQVYAGAGKRYTPPYTWGTVLQFGAMGNCAAYKQKGWCKPTAAAAWTNGASAQLDIPIPKTRQRDILLNIEIEPFLVEGKLKKQRVSLQVKEQTLAQWELTQKGFQKFQVTIPCSLPQKGSALPIRFQLPDAAAPNQLGVNNDQRLLAVNVRSLQLKPGPKAQRDQKKPPPLNRPMKIVFIREIFGWMGDYSGYDQVCKHIAQNESYRTQWTLRKVKPITPPLKRKIYNFLLPRVVPNPFYNVNSLQAECIAFKKAFKLRADILHISYVENNYAALKSLKILSPARLVGTVHQPPEWWEENHKKKHILRSLDAIIVLTPKIKSYFEQFCPGRVYWLPHGIDTAFFSPPPGGHRFESKMQRPRIVFSGHWLRDIKTLYAVIEALHRRKPAVRFDLLVPKHKRYDDYFKKIGDLGCVSWHAGVSDEALRDIYRSAFLLFLPLLDCTANNAVLEAMACGIPVLSNQVGGIPDYTDPSFAELLPVGDAEGFTRSILHLVDNPGLIEERGALARTYAEEHLNWPIIAEKTLDVYRRLL